MTGRDLIEFIEANHLEDCTVEIGHSTDPLGVDYVPIDETDIEAEDGTIRIC